MWHQVSRSCASLRARYPLRVMWVRRDCTAITGPADVARPKRTPHNFCVYYQASSFVADQRQSQSSTFAVPAGLAPWVSDSNRSNDLGSTRLQNQGEQKAQDGLVFLPKPFSHVRVLSSTNVSSLGTLRRLAGPRKGPA